MYRAEPSWSDQQLLLLLLLPLADGDGDDAPAPAPAPAPAAAPADAASWPASLLLLAPLVPLVLGVRCENAATSSSICI